MAVPRIEPGPLLRTVAHGRFLPVLALVCFCPSARAAPDNVLIPRALAQALHGTRASGVVLDARTGAILASSRTNPRATPGSALKPLLLEYALEHQIVHPETQVYCARNLRVGNRLLRCTHTADQPVFNAERALAESCNTWFAAMAQRFTGPQLEAALERSHLQHAPMNDASVEQRQIAVLGLGGVTVTPLELAQAYREMLARTPPDGVVSRGLKESVDYGMANPAAVPDVAILGKTGTASDPGETWTHGWFAGAIRGQLVLVIYVPHGDGGTSARLAQTFFRMIAQQPHKERPAP